MKKPLTAKQKIGVAFGAVALLILSLAVSRHLGLALGALVEIPPSGLFS